MHFDKTQHKQKESILHLKNFTGKNKSSNNSVNNSTAKNSSSFNLAASRPMIQQKNIIKRENKNSTLNKNNRRRDAEPDERKIKNSSIDKKLPVPQKECRRFRKLKMGSHYE